MRPCLNVQMTWAAERRRQPSDLAAETIGEQVDSLPRRRLPAGGQLAHVAADAGHTEIL